MDDFTHIMDGLNSAQLEAVTAGAGPLLVLAGAGSGKTRVLTRRIALLIESGQVKPWQVMAVTFTNKAAREMRGRIRDLLGHSAERLYIGTFHGISHQLLRTNHEAAGLAANFEIIDAADQKRLLKNMIKEAGYGKEVKESLVAWQIDKLKNRGVRAEDKWTESVKDDLIAHVYKIYENYCLANDLVDFGELLLRTVELMECNEVVRTRYQEQFHHVLVDEFQDTNAIQYRWLKLFCGKHGNVTVVGDDDQSIYGWRGAQVTNMLNFSRAFPKAREIYLEQNYRSTSNILKVANAIIENNESRYEKSLWTEAGDGPPVRMHLSYDEIGESKFVASVIGKWVESGNKFSDVAVLYRTNAQSLVFEQTFSEAGFPYQVHGGFRFFERMEIKTVLAYLRLLLNRNADLAFARAVNMPSRGIGNAMLEYVGGLAKREESSMWEAVKSIVDNPGQHHVNHRPLERFVNLIEELAGCVEKLSLPKLIAKVNGASGLISHYEKKTTEDAVSRRENLDEMINAGARFAEDSVLSGNEEILDQFLANASLDAGDRQQSSDGFIQIMTLHSAKGLEFPLVFMTGMLEDLLPHANSRASLESLEEERRLCYVGMTRAIKELYLTASRTRFIRGIHNQFHHVSRFVAEIPSELLVQSEIGNIGAEKRTKPQKTNEFAAGVRVNHAKFGDGVVTDLTRSNGSVYLQIKFEGAGMKWINTDVANLRKL